VKGKLNPARSKGIRGDINLYDEKELDKIKSEREQVTYIERPQTDTQESHAIELAAKSADIRGLLVDAIREAINTATTPEQLRYKTFLTLQEAHVLTGLKPRTLSRLIKEKKLKAQKIANAYRIAPPDLDKLQK
jgi:excisionase family DNA binding protein